MKLSPFQLECAIHWSRHAPHCMPYVKSDGVLLTISSANNSAASTFGWNYETQRSLQGAVDLEMLLRSKSVSRLLRLVKGTGAPKPLHLENIEFAVLSAKIVNMFFLDTLIVRQTLLRIKSNVVKLSINQSGTLTIANIPLNVQPCYGIAASEYYETDNLRAVFSVTCSNRLTATMSILPNNQGTILELYQNAGDHFEDHKLMPLTLSRITPPQTIVSPRIYNAV